MQNHLGPRRGTWGAWIVAGVIAAAPGCTAPVDGPDDPTTSPDASATAAPGTQVGIPDPDDVDPARLEPLAGLPDCPSEPPAADGGDVEGLPLPEGAVTTSTDETGGLRSVQGFSPRTPVEIMVAYLRLDGWEVVAAEDEVFESEVLLDDGELRVFVKSQAACARGSAFALFASRDAGQVPVPTGPG